MKIDKEKFPALFDNDIVIRQYKNLIPDEMLKLYYKIMQLARQNTFYIASTILDHISESFAKLAQLKNDLPEVTRGVLFVSDKPDNPDKVCGPTALFYMITHQEDRIIITGQISLTENGKQFGQMIAGYFLKADEKLMFHAYEAVPGRDNVTKEVVSHIVAIELFINYADVETKILEPSRQIWDGPRAIYNNKSKVPITVVDSSWYTNLVSSGAFKVRGHFRLQPHGHGLKKRKLIWINDFEKEGYTRKAKIEQTLPENENN